MDVKANPPLFLCFFAAITLVRDTTEPQLEPDLLKKDTNDRFCELTLVFLTISFSTSVSLSLTNKLYWYNFQVWLRRQPRNLCLYTWLRLVHFRLKLTSYNEPIHEYVSVSFLGYLWHANSSTVGGAGASSNPSNSPSRVGASRNQLNTGSLFEMIVLWVTR